MPHVPDLSHAPCPLPLVLRHVAILPRLFQRTSFATDNFLSLIIARKTPNNFQSLIIARKNQRITFKVTFFSNEKLSGLITQV
jgi:hypothetical protein